MISLKLQPVYDYLGNGSLPHPTGGKRVASG